MEAPCQHSRTEVIARRDGVDYVRCLDCDQICEAEDLESSPAGEEDDEALVDGKPSTAAPPKFRKNGRSKPGRK